MSPVSDPVPLRVRELRDGRERTVPAATLCVPPFALDYTARLLAHAGGAVTLEPDEARALGPVPVASFGPGDEVFLEAQGGGPWPLVAVLGAAAHAWTLLPCGASVLRVEGVPLRVTDGAMEAMISGEPSEGVDPARIVAELEALTGMTVTLGPWAQRDDELERSAAVTVVTSRPRG